MVAKVISELKWVARLKFFSRNWHQALKATSLAAALQKSVLY